MSKNERRGGRRPNSWSTVTWDQIEEHLNKPDMTNSAFIAAVGTTASSFHNWKKGKNAPDLQTQERIQAVLQGKAVQPVEKETKMAKKKTRASRGSGSSLLASLKGGAEKVVTEVKKKATKKKIKKAKKAVEKVAAVVEKAAAPPKKRGRKPGPRAKKASPTAKKNGAIDNGAWAELGLLKQFITANGGKSPEQLRGVLEFALQFTA